MMEQHWVSARVVSDLTGWHPQHVRRLAREGQLQHRPSKSLRHDGRAQREYALSSLPVEAQLKFLKQPLLSGPDCTALALRSDLNQSKLFASLPEVTEPERLNFSAKQNAQAMKRLEAIAPLVEFARRSRRSRPTFRTSGGVAVRNKNSLAVYLANQHHRRPDHQFSELNTHPTYSPVYASPCTSRCPAQNSGPSGSLLLSRKDSSSSASCRFSPAHCNRLVTPSTLEAQGCEKSAEADRYIISRPGYPQWKSPCSGWLISIDPH